MSSLDENKSLSYIHPVTAEALNLFAQRVIEHEGDNLKSVVLFGSVARNEANEDSDVDVLVILKQCARQHFKNISAIGADVHWDMDFNENAYIQPVTISEKDSEGLEFWSLMENIKKDGVVLYGADN
ncbi:hypothetical protein FACS1894187_18270 [Synergistales bacterium]|nr:hypothetical protein FACS1894187_18270 [Synergistales bacterium]